MIKRIFFTILLMLNTNLALAFPGVNIDSDLFTSDGVTLTPKYGLVLPGAMSSNLTVGTSIITGGTAGYLLYNNSGILGNLNPAGLTLAWSQITSTPSTLSGYGITSPLDIAEGGTASATASGALTNLLPSQTGNSGKVLQSNGTSAAWQTPTGGFTSRGSAYQSVTNISFPSGDTVLTFNNLDVGFGSTTEMDVVTHPGRFTSIAGGVYHVDAAYCLNSSNSTLQQQIVLYKNNSVYRYGINLFEGATPVPGFSANVVLAAGDYIELHLFQSTGSGITGGCATNGTLNWFQVVQIQ